MNSRLFIQRDTIAQKLALKSSERNVHGAKRISHHDTVSLTQKKWENGIISSTFKIFTLVARCPTQDDRCRTH
eukprot:755755-Hanusia_phi.AAC.2